MVVPEPSDHCEECGAPDDGTQSYCDECKAPLIEEKHMPDSVNRPGPAWQEWTVTLPGDGAVVVYVENNYRPETRMRRLLELADCDAYMTTCEHVPEREKA